MGRLEFSKSYEEKTCTDAINKFGLMHQIIKALEELMEQVQELRGIYIELLHDGYADPDSIVGLAEEIADTEIVDKQMKIAFQIEERVKTYKDLKLHKLNQLMEREEQNE